MAPWEHSSRGIRLHEAGDVEATLDAFRRGLNEFPGDVSLLYNLACIESLSGHADDAVAHLRTAADLDPRVCEWARDDEDLDPIRDDPAFPA